MAQFFVIVQIGCVLLHYFLEDQVIYFISTWFVVGITSSKSQYLFQKVILYPGEFTLLWICLFIMGIVLFLPMLTSWLSIVDSYLVLWGRELWVTLQLQSFFSTM